LLDLLRLRLDADLDRRQVELTSNLRKLLPERRDVRADREQQVRIELAFSHR
jgi:hypothetical protein